MENNIPAVEIGKKRMGSIAADMRCYIRFLQARMKPYEGNAAGWGRFSDHVACIK